MDEPTITSLQNPRVKEAVRLRERRPRDKQHRILIDGARELLRAIEAGVGVREVFVCEALCHSPEAAQVLALLRSSRAAVSHVTVEVFAKLAYGERAEGLLAVADTPTARLEDLPPLPENPLVAVIEAVEKPGNIGAVLRTADAAGVAAVIVAGGRTDLFNPNAIRASLGTIFNRNVAAASTDETLAWLRARSLKIIAARVDAAEMYTAVSYQGPTAIVLGAEDRGLSSAWTALDVTPVRLPMLGAADSLNVSATAAVLFYEALRQRVG
jgi:RNA methyltransferase, TrmH family